MRCEPLDILVVDDSALYRMVTRAVIASIPDCNVVNVAADGSIALRMIDEHEPDLVFLDLEMPCLDGLGVLRELRSRPEAPGVIMLSAFTDDGAATTIEALNLGAFDFVLKPRAVDPETGKAMLRDLVEPKIEAFRHAQETRRGAPTRQSGSAATPIVPSATGPARAPHAVGIGISTGGPSALGRLLPALPGEFALPIFIVQHMPKKFTRSLADSLDARCAIAVREAADGDAVVPGQAYLAPGGRQMMVVRDGTTTRIRLTDDVPESGCRPAVDSTFRSLATVYGGNVLAVIMTGMGRDGLEGCRALARCGATILAQDEGSCVVYGMPREIVEHELARRVLPIDGLARRIAAAGCGRAAA